MTYLSLKQKKSSVLIVLFLLLVYGCVSYPKIKILSNSSVEVIVEIADTAAQHYKGLMFRDSLEEGAGMLFVFDEQSRAFWMKNTKIPLDIIFISSDFKIVDIKENFLPCKTLHCETYTSKPAKYALEVNVGFVDEHEIVIGNTIMLN